MLGIIDTIPSQFLEGLGLDGAFSRSMVSMKFWAKRWKSSISPNLRPASSASFSMVVLYNVVQLSLVAIAEYLKNIIDKNHQLATENMRLAAHAKKIATSTADQNEQLRMALQMKGKANQAGRLEKSNLSYQQLLGKLQNIYDLLSKWAVHIDFLDLAADWPTWVMSRRRELQASSKLTSTTISGA